MSDNSILIDTTVMRVLKVHSDPVCLDYWAEILIPKNDNTVRGYTPNDFNCFSPGDINRLYEETTDRSPHPSLSHEYKIRGIINAINAMPVDTTPLDELKKKLGRPLPLILITSDDEDEEPEKRSYTSRGDDTILKRPAEGTTTGMVWDIADAIAVKSEHAIGSKQLRAEIIAECSDEGIHPSTAATQYAKWKKFKSMEA